jgi:hypothetical protein
MRVGTVRKPGESGTEKLVAKYGDHLVAVRYRYSHAERKRFKTVELIVAEDDWTPPPSRDEIVSNTPPPKLTPCVPLRIRYFEKDLQRMVKAIGGTWDPDQKLWYAPEDSARRAGLSDRIVR